MAALDFAGYWRVVVGLIIGGAFAAPFAGWLGKVLPQRLLMAMVAVVVGAIGLYNLMRFAGAP